MIKLLVTLAVLVAVIIIHRATIDRKVKRLDKGE